MANAAWVKGTETGHFTYYTATINGTDTQTAILPFSPAWRASMSIDHGGSDTLSVNISTAENASAMITANSSIGSDYEDTILGPITGLQISGASAGTHTIYLIIAKASFTNN